MGHPPPPQDASEVQPNDPLHDIDARRTSIGTAVTVVAIFASMWLLSVLFHFILDQEYEAKVSDRETIELNALRAWEHTELTKTENLGNDTERISIDEAIRRLSTK